MSFGPRRDGQHTFQRLDGNPLWAGIPELDDAGPRAITAYLRTYGPASRDHIHYWLGSGLSAGRKRLDGWISDLGDRLAAVDVEGTTAYVAREDVDSLAAASPSQAVRFLPGHDQWVMGPGTNDVHVTPPALRAAMTRKTNPLIASGVVRGTWSRKGDELTINWQDERRPPWDAIEQEAVRLGAVLGRHLQIRVAS